MIESTMVHLNSNMMVSIWIETSGNDPRRHDICEICALLINNHFKLSTAITPFYNMIQPLRPENIDLETASINRERINNAIIKGLPPSIAADRFEDWVMELDMPKGKRIVPIVHNWGRVSAFLRNWLGINNFNYLVSSEVRDIQTVALYHNDCANIRAKPIPYAKVLDYFIGELHAIQLLRKMDVMEKALRLAEIYRLMLGVSNN